MADFSALIQRIKDAVYENGVQAITGQILQDCLKDVVNTVNVAKQDGIYRVTVTVDNNTGVPSATASMDDDTYTLEFSFHNLKGEKGDKGDKGDTPVLTADSDGVIYSDGVMLTRVIKDTTDALTTRADSDHARAESDHARAETDHTDITRARLDAETAAGEANYASLRANTAADNADAAREAIQSDLAAKQDVIVDLPQIRAGATDTVKYSTQSLTDAQKGQARANIGAASDSEVSQLRSEKADKDGYYPEMSVGSLKGTEVTQVEGITAIAKSTGLAKINEVMGRSLVWNELVVNGNFSLGSDGLDGWHLYPPSGSGSVASVSVTNGVARLQASIPAETSAQFSLNQTASVTPIIGHKYRVRFTMRKGENSHDSVFWKFGTSTYNARIPDDGYYVNTIITAVNEQRFWIWAYNNAASETPVTYDWYYEKVSITDLTVIFGTGNEPSTVAEFESWLANNIGYRDYYAYNPGEIISNNTEALEITGLNQWDEEWEVGTINRTTGVNVSGTAQIRVPWKHIIKVSPNTVYCIKWPKAVSDGNFIYFYDIDKNYISSILGNDVTTKTFTTPSNCAYLRFVAVPVVSRTYTHDICVSVSGSRDGEYEPYQKSELELNLTTITGKLNGEGESVVIFPDGMRSAGTAYDSLIVDEDGWCRRAVVRMKKYTFDETNYIISDNWRPVDGYFAAGFRAVMLPDKKSGLAGTIGNLLMVELPTKSYNDLYDTDTPEEGIAVYQGGNYSVFIRVASAKATSSAELTQWLNGKSFIYELATPLEYVLDTPIQMTFQAKHGGVIRQLPENGSEPTTAPMRMSVTYALDAVSILTDLPENYVSKESLQAMLSAMQSAGLFSAYTMTFNESTGKYEFTFTANA